MDKYWRLSCLFWDFFDVFNVNISGQVGDNSQTNRNTPTDVVGLGSGVIRTSHGYVRFCT